LEENGNVFSSDIDHNSKQFTAASLVLPQNQGKLSLSDDVRTFIPELPDYGNVISIRHLLNRTSGIRDYILDDLHTAREKRATLLQEPIQDPIFPPDEDLLPL
jgi:CubicO group peptidase (beta-lactamase class C family)